MCSIQTRRPQECLCLLYHPASELDWPTLMPAILSSPLNLFCRVVPAPPDSGDSQPHFGTAPAALSAFMASRMSEENSSFCRMNRMMPWSQVATCILFVAEGQICWSAGLRTATRNGPANELAPGVQSVSTLRSVSDMCTDNEPTAQVLLLVWGCSSLKQLRWGRCWVGPTSEQCINAGGGGWHDSPLPLLGLHTTSLDTLTVGTTPLTIESGAFLKAEHDSPNSVHRGAVSTDAVVVSEL